MTTRQDRLLLITFLCLCLGVALSGATLIFAQAESEQMPIHYIWGKVTYLTGDKLNVQTDAGDMEFILTAETQYKISRVEDNILENIGLEEITQDNIRVEDLVAVLTQLDKGETTDLAQIVVVLPQSAAENLSPTGIQPAQAKPDLTNSPALPCQAQIDGATTVYSSPQEAVDAASSGEVIKVSGYCAGVFTRHSLTQSVYADKSLAFIGGYDTNFDEPPDPAQYSTILDAMGKGRSLVVSRTVQVSVTGIKLKDGNAANLTGDPVINSDMGGNIYAAGDSALNIINSEVESGRATIGGGLFLSGTVNISGTTFSNNIGESVGGGVYNDGGAISITNSAFNNNIGVGVGGGLFNISGTVAISGSNFNGNLANGTGGGLFNTGGAIDITDSTFSGNFGIGTGGGILNDNGLIAISNSTFSDNYAAGAGGGIYNESSQLAITNSTFNDNYAAGTGGGINNESSQLAITNSIFHANVTSGAGGGVINLGGEMVIAESTFLGNSTAGTGGGVLNDSGPMTITSSTLRGNYASDAGGVYNYSSTINTIINSTISQNRAYNGPGGGIYNDGGATLVISNSTIAENSSSATGGGIYNFDSSAVLSMTNSVIAYHNSSGDCGGDFTQVTSFGYNLSNDTTCSFLVATNDISDTNPLLGPLQDNGGPTETHLPMDGSDAIDSANPAACPENDQRGVSRPADGDGDGSAVCDRGSVEVLLDVFYLPLVIKSP